MYSAKFAPLTQNEDYKLDTVPHGTPQYTDPAMYQQQMYQQQYQQQQQQQQQIPQQQPQAWQNAAYNKPGHHAHVTYVSTPTEYSNGDQRPFDAKGRRRSSRLSFLANPVSTFKIPTFAAPWQHEPTGPPPASSRTSTVRYFDRKKQWWRLFTNGLIQWMMTLAIVGIICVTLWGFIQIKPMSRWQRYTFNAVMTLLSLCLGLAVVSALRSYAKLLSWRFLAAEYRDLQDFELIMNCSSQTKVLKLLWAGRTPGRFWLNRTQLLCIASLSLVIGLQIVIALMGLTYSVETSDMYLDHKPGNISLVDLSSPGLDNATTKDTNSRVAGASAYSYGITGSTYTVYTSPPGLSHRQENLDGYRGPESIGTPSNESWAYFYQFIEWPARQQSSVWGETKRYVESEATCTQLEIIDGGYLGNDTMSFYDESGANVTTALAEMATWTSLYMANQSYTECGPRCARVLVLDVGYDPATDADATEADVFWPSVLWGCNSTLSQVYHTETCTYKENCTITDELAPIIAGAIGYSGVIYPDAPHMQFRRFTSEWVYSWVSLTDEQVSNADYRGTLIAYFSSAVVAAMDDSGSRIYAPGQEPVTGVILEVKWYYTIPVLAIVPGVQFFVLLIVCIWANGVLVKDGSYLATAQMLRPVVEKLEQHGCALTGDEIARELGNFKVIYGAKTIKGTQPTTEYGSPGATNADWHCGVILESEGYGQQAAEGWRPGRVWPAGRYDGIGYVDEEEEIETNEKSHLL